MTRVSNGNPTNTIHYSRNALMALNIGNSYSETIRNSVPAEIRARPLEPKKIQWAPGLCNPLKIENSPTDEDDRNLDLLVSSR